MNARAAQDLAPPPAAEQANARRAQWLLGFVATAVVALTAWTWAGAPPQALRTGADFFAEHEAALVNRPLPPFVLRDLAGQRFELGSLRGKRVFLNLYASWCPPCREEFPAMLELAASLAQTQDDFVMVAVSWDEDASELAAFLASLPQPPKNVLMLSDPGGELTRQLGTRLLPETYFVAVDGTVLARFQNVRDWNDEAYARYFRAD